MEHRIYQQWPHENTHARSPQQMVRDLFCVRLLHRVGEDVVVPVCQVTLENGKQYGGWLWDYNRTEHGEYAALLIEFPGDEARSTDLVYFNVQETTSVVLIAGEEQGFQLPPFTIKRRFVGPEVRQIEVDRKALEYTRALSAQLRQDITFNLAWDKADTTTQQGVVTYQELLSRAYSCIYRQTSNKAFVKSFNRVTEVVVTMAKRTSLTFESSIITLAFDGSAEEPAELSRNAISNFLSATFGK